MKKRNLLLFFLIVNGWCISMAQTGRLTIQEAVSLMGNQQSDVYSSLSKKNYSYKGRDGNFETFEKDKAFGYSLLNVAFKNKRVNGIGWKESVMYASTIMSEVLREGFVLDDKSVASIQVFRNEKRQLILTLIDQSNSGYIVVTIGKPTVKQQDEIKSRVSEPKDSIIHPRKNKQPQAKFTPPTQKDSISKRLFTGTRSFCDAEKIWKYEVTVKNDSITLKLFPGSANSHHKNKSKPIEIIKGIVGNGKIITKNSQGYLTNRFKYQNGILYEVNNEGDYNNFPECK